MRPASRRRLAATMAVGAVGLAACAGSGGGAAANDVMVYQGDANHTVIVTIRGDGTGKSSPTDDVPGQDQTNPDWSPDGKRIVFAVSDGADDLWTVNADGTGAEMLLACDDPCVFLDDPAWSPDGASVMYERMVVKDGAMTSTLESVDVQTGKVTVWLTAPPTDGYAGVRYSSDGTQVVFEQVHTVGTTPDAEALGVSLNVFDLRHPDRPPVVIVAPELFPATADWGPNSSTIVFAALPAAGASATDLFTVRPDGTGLTRLTNLADDGGYAAEPAWSVDGSTIYFSAGVSGEQGVLAKVSAKGGDVSPAFGKQYDVHGRHPRLHKV